LQAQNIFNDSRNVLLYKAHNSQPGLMKDRARMGWQGSEE